VQNTQAAAKTMDQALDMIAHVAFESGVDPKHALAIIKKVADEALSRPEAGEQRPQRVTYR
jgi:hypothetical protein